MKVEHDRSGWFCCPAGLVVMLMGAAAIVGCSHVAIPVIDRSPLASDCLAQFARNEVEPKAHLQTCEAVVDRYPLQLRAHLDYFIVLQHYGQEIEACSRLASLPQNHESLTTTATDLEDLAFSLENICRFQERESSGG